jgi:transposase
VRAEFALGTHPETPHMRAIDRPRPTPRPSLDSHLGKPRGLLSPRVQAVGPEHFGIVAVDPAKTRSKWMLANFYGRVLIRPTFVEHRSDAFAQAIAILRQAIANHLIHDTIVAVERTGRYHLPLLRSYAAAGFDTRIVHPTISRHFRQAGAFDTKTDDTDLEGIFRAAINGFGLQEPPWDCLFTALQLWARHRRDLVRKSTLLRCQLREHLEACLPGYAQCFDDVFSTKIALHIPRRYPTPQAVAAAGLPGLTQWAKQGAIRVQAPTLTRILGWAQNAPVPDRDAPLHQRLVETLDDDRSTKERQVRAVECDLVGHLVQTPYVRLLAIAGVNVVLASEFAGEAGPIAHYATGRVVTGRAGLYPRRYQSDQVDYASGSLARRGNRRLRQVLLLTADTLIRCNDHFRALAAKWSDQGKDPRDIHVRVAGRYARIAFAMVAGTAAFRHPACQGPAAVTAKLLVFHIQHGIDLETTRTNLGRAAARLPAAEQVRERAALSAQWEAARTRRGRGPRQLCEILPAVLSQMVGGDAAPLIESSMSGETP